MKNKDKRDLMGIRMDASQKGQLKVLVSAYNPKRRRLEYLGGVFKTQKLAAEFVQLVTDGGGDVISYKRGGW